MKNWERPEIKICSVCMNENIASSGTGGLDVYQTKTVNFLPGGDILIYVNGNTIVDTRYIWYMDGNTAKAANVDTQNQGGSAGDWILTGSTCRV